MIRDHLYWSIDVSNLTDFLCKQRNCVDDTVHWLHSWLVQEKRLTNLHAEQNIRLG